MTTTPDGPVDDADLDPANSTADEPATDTELDPSTGEPADANQDDEDAAGQTLAEPLPGEDPGSVEG